MMFYNILRRHKALETNHWMKQLTGVAVIPEGPVRIRIRGKQGIRPWREATMHSLEEDVKLPTHKSKTVTQRKFLNTLLTRRADENWSAWSSQLIACAVMEPGEHK